MLCPHFTQAGIARLFYWLRLFDASFHSLSLRLRPLMSADGRRLFGFSLTQMLTAVLDLSRDPDPGKSNSGDDSSAGGAWTLGQLLGTHQPLERCAIATTSAVIVAASAAAGVCRSNLSLLSSPPPSRVAAGTARAPCLYVSD